MPKVTLNKSTKIKGKGLILAGIEVEVTPQEKKDLESNGFLGEVKKDLSPGNDKEIAALVKKVEDHGKEIDAKNAEIEALKVELAESLKGNDNLLGETKGTKAK